MNYLRDMKFDYLNDMYKFSEKIQFTKSSLKGRSSVSERLHRLILRQQARERGHLDASEAGNREVVLNRK